MSLAPNNWCITVSDQVYGPYTDQQMEALAAEGRLVATSLVSPAGANRWREAHQFETLNRLFSPTAETKETGKAFGKAGITPGAADGEDPQSILLVIFDTIACPDNQLHFQKEMPTQAADRSLLASVGCWNRTSLSPPFQ